MGMKIAFAFVGFDRRHLIEVRSAPDASLSPNDRRAIAGVDLTLT
ncbi:hypothetical protein [Trinickia dinghuensis]|nr:hypothetical protein [Trinickia dinghuensis]